MQDNYFILWELSKYLSGKLVHSEITGCFSQEKEQVILNLKNNGKEYYLVYSCSNEFPHLYLRDNFAVACKNIARVFDNLIGVNIQDISIDNDDRLIVLQLSNSYKLIYSFAKNKLNLFLTGEDVILNSFKNKIKYINQRLSEVLRPKTIHVNEADTVKEYLKKKYLKYGRLYYDEILFSLNINYHDLLNPGIKEGINKEFRRINKALESPEFLLYKNEDKILISLIRLASLENNFNLVIYDNINDLLLACLKEVHRKKYLKNTKEKTLKELISKINNNRKKYENINRQYDEALNSQKYLEYGNAILQNINIIKNNQEKLEVEINGKNESIRLFTNLTAAENAQKYFEKYKKQKSSLKLLQIKIKKLEEENEVFNNKLTEVRDMSDYKQIKKLEKSKPVPDENDETCRFRKFILEKNFQVWVGKDSKSNDLLTMKYSSPNDLWFHIRGTSGSHTVLKTNNITENIDKKIIQVAASVCAYYSKARNAGTVPVAYCLRKYVKKKKGFKQGSVIMEREKVIFVKPGLPE